MWLVFADDSEQLNPTRAELGHLIGIGAVLFPEATVATYAERVKAAREDLGVRRERRSNGARKTEAGSRPKRANKLARSYGSE
ncbi:hypothetical protein AB0K15_39245 [Amycolatopsis sp. NPDC049253]|uniref:hypothetical protein n=1 Tax=Amycolatopsis sp. NPDC049253 TaxID=3155274 RepID=UPI00343302FA